VTVAIRPLVEADLPALARGLAALPLMERYGRTAPKLEAALCDALARGEGLRVAEAGGGAVVGLAWFLTTGTLAMGGYLKLIAVLEGAQGQHAGAALLAAFEAEVAKASAHAFLLVSDFNASAQVFYERHGYLRAGQLPGLVLPDVAEELFWKRLR
jgi:ribosomal protein S18 acetylase RimI-like enzyme